MHVSCVLVLCLFGCRPPALKQIEFFTSMYRSVCDPVFIGMDNIPTERPLLFVSNHTIMGFEFPLMLYELYARKGMEGAVSQSSTVVVAGLTALAFIGQAFSFERWLIIATFKYPSMDKCCAMSWALLMATSTLPTCSCGLGSACGCTR